MKATPTELKYAEAVKAHGSTRKAADVFGVNHATVHRALQRMKRREEGESQRGKRILVLPDVQAKPGIDFSYLSRIGQYALDKRPDIIVCIGDFADMPSLSSYDKGKKSFEGRRYKRDIEAAQFAMQAFLKPIKDHNEKQRKPYHPRMVLTLGNHEARISRACDDDPKLDGVLSLKDLAYEEYGWQVVPFLEVIVIEGVAFSHYFTSGVMGRPAGTAAAQLRKANMSCVSGHQQGKQIAYATRADGATITSIIAGSCMHPSHKVLTADLRYIPLGQLKVGDKLVSFDEGGSDGASGQRKNPRRFKTGTVTNLRSMRGPMYDVTLSGGKVFRVTGDHLWFTKNTGSLYSWKRTDQLRLTNESALGKKGGGTRVVRLLDEFQHDLSWESGWLAGMYCGEGHLYHRKTTGGGVMQLALSQSESHNPATCRRIEDALRNVCGVDVTKDKAVSRTTAQYRINGGAKKIAKVLGTVRPPRMMDKFVPEMLGSLTNKSENEAEHIVSITPAGEDDYVQIEIDAKTMIVEGYGHHNCYEHEEAYLGAQGNRHYRGFVMLHEVRDGRFDEMWVSLDFINSRYPHIAYATPAYSLPTEAEMQAGRM